MEWKSLTPEVLDLGECWQYGRYLELLELLGIHDQVCAMMAEGLRMPTGEWPSRGQRVRTPPSRAPRFRCGLRPAAAQRGQRNPSSG